MHVWWQKLKTNLNLINKTMNLCIFDLTYLLVRSTRYGPVYIFYLKLLLLNLNSTLTYENYNHYKTYIYLININFDKNDKIG